MIPRLVHDMSAWRVARVQHHGHHKELLVALLPHLLRSELCTTHLVAAARQRGRLLSEARRLLYQVQPQTLPQTQSDARPTFADLRDHRLRKRVHTDNSDDSQRRDRIDQGRWRSNGKYQIKRRKCSSCPPHSPRPYPLLQWTTQGRSLFTPSLSLIAGMTIYHLSDSATTDLRQ
jgi:hypothetical protein